MDERALPSSGGRPTDANTVPMELMQTVVKLIAAAEQNGSPVLTAEQLAVTLRQSEETIKRAWRLS